jgi:hypothetical protein
MPGGGGVLTNPFFNLLNLFFLALMVIKLFALVDASLRRQPLFETAGKQTKTFWLIILVLAVIWDLLAGSLIHPLSILGLIAAIVYIVDVRPALRALGKGGPRGGGGQQAGPYGPW